MAEKWQPGAALAHCIGRPSRQAMAATLLRPWATFGVVVYWARWVSGGPRAFGERMRLEEKSLHG